MSDPSQLASAGTGTSIVGTGIKMFGEWYSGQADSNAAKYRAAVARQNAVLAKQDAIYARSIGEVEAEQSGMRTRALVADTRTRYGAGNISSATGSPAKVLASETAIGQADEATIRARAAKRAYGFSVAAAQDTAEAGLADVAAETAQTSSFINMASTAVGAAGSVADKWYQSQQTFPTGQSPGVNPDSVQGRVTYSNSIFN